MELVVAFIGVLDRLIKLLERKEARNARLFEKFVDPLFRDFEPVANDYVRFFADSSKELENAISSPHALNSMLVASRRIRARRNEFLMARKKVQQLAKLAATQMSDDDVRDFAITVASFFYGSDLYYHTSESKKVADLFDLVAAWRMFWFLPENPVTRTRGSMTPEALVTMIWTTQMNLERTWEDIVQQHAQLRLKLLRL